MWCLILLLLYSLVVCANRCSEECFLYGTAGDSEDEIMEPRERSPEKV
jgi:hypothetical protein